METVLPIGTLLLMSQTLLVPKEERGVKNELSSTFVIEFRLRERRALCVQYTVASKCSKVCICGRENAA
jgi:hypothetical protein